ncbi:hypothetical protein [Bradyrhizobium neotropicale]|uniref:hypothetical protein n=1 Tax=Bradyrhizobium neotropicale TaxID=1497615 RepID=UPI001AD75B05|nr:hypothetical protein [Bradyrhizobium neotropicale]MBO4227398.1 hypothetical protein [Bradyrhizobium neotropicale]
MTDAVRIPAPPRQSLYGWPLPDRREEFVRLASQPGAEMHRVADFKGQTVALPILRIPLNLPKYRISNGRTASAQQEWVANKHRAADFFDNGDPELEEIQIAQHQILTEMIREEGLLAKFEDSANKQVDPLLLDENGFVVNGNRRLCCWRVLHTKSESKYGHFGHIDIVVLPHCDEQELDRLEAKLQIEKDIRSDYTWDAEANMMAQKQRLHGFTTPQLAQLYGKSKREIEDLLAMRELAVEYLRSRGKENVWSEVKDDRFAFRELLKARNSTSSASDREIIKQASFALIDDPENAGDRLYAVIPKVREYLPAVKTALAEAFPAKPVQTDVTAEEAFGGFEEHPAGTTSPAISDLALVGEIKRSEASITRARGVVIETIRSQDEQSRERDAADFLFKTLKKANALLQNASGHGLRPESSVDGVSSQISSIRSALSRIEEWLAERRS